MRPPSAAVPATLGARIAVRTDDGWRPRKRRISLTFRTVLTGAQDTRDAAAPISTVAEAPGRAYAGSTTSGRPSAGLGMGMTRQRGR